MVCSKPVTRKYAFEHADVPDELEVLKVKYNAGLYMHVTDGVMVRLTTAQRTAACLAISKDAPSHTVRSCSHIAILTLILILLLLVFGSNVPVIERFLMKRKMYGPSWLRISGATPVSKSESISWCKLEGRVDNPKNICVVEDQPEAPPITVMAIGMQTILNRSNHTSEVLLSVICPLSHHADVMLFGFRSSR